MAEDISRPGVREIEHPRIVARVIERGPRGVPQPLRFGTRAIVYGKPLELSVTTGVLFRGKTLQVHARDLDAINILAIKVNGVDQLAACDDKEGVAVALLCGVPLRLDLAQVGMVVSITLRLPNGTPPQHVSAVLFGDSFMNY